MSDPVSLPKYVQERTRDDRMHNIAVRVLLEANLGLNSKPLKERQTVYLSTHRIREDIRSALSMTPGDEMDSELRLGDLRANGDAVGKCGLALDTKMRDERKYVELSDYNIVKCQEFLTKKTEPIYID